MFLNFNLLTFGMKENQNFKTCFTKYKNMHTYKYVPKNVLYLCKFTNIFLYEQS